VDSGGDSGVGRAAAGARDAGVHGGARALALGQVRRALGRSNPRVAGLLMLLAFAVGFLVAQGGAPLPDPDAGFFTVESHASPLEPAVAADARFRLVAPGSFGRGEADLMLVGLQISIQRDDQGLSALEALRQAVRAWQREHLLLEEDEAAAFPVRVDVHYEARQLQPGPTTAATTTTAAPTATTTGTATSTLGPEPETIGNLTRPTSVRTGLLPGQVDPPFPIRSLLLTFAYVLPASLLAQVHAGDMHAERMRRRGLLLLASPLGPGRILLGKILPHAALFVVLAAIVTWLLGAGILGFLASLAVLAFLLAATTFLAILASSLRELSLLQVAMSTALNVFLFLPAMFPAIPPVAFLSPMHVVASGIRGDAVGWGAFLYATMPLSLAAVALVALSVGFMREETFFSIASSTRRIRDALERITRGPWRVLLAGVLVVPFAFAAEVLLFVLLAVLGVELAIVLFLPAAVLAETLAKAVPVFARAGAGNARAGPRPWLVGVLVGSGFFLAEKLALVLGLVGFRDLPYGDAALALLGSGIGPLLLVAPLALHVATATLMAVGAARGRAGAWLGGFAALALHFGYDHLIFRSFA
jgi:ABC-type Na+ efflux pump permease subunit